MFKIEYLLLMVLFFYSCNSLNDESNKEIKFNMDDYGYPIELVVKQHINSSKSMNNELVEYLDSIYPEKIFPQSGNDRKIFWDRLKKIQLEEPIKNNLLLAIDHKIIDNNDETIGVVGSYSYFPRYDVKGTWSYQKDNDVNVAVVKYSISKNDGIENTYPTLIVISGEQKENYWIQQTAFYDLTQIDITSPEWNKKKSNL